MECGSHAAAFDPAAMLPAALTILRNGGMPRAERVAYGSNIRISTQPIFAIAAASADKSAAVPRPAARFPV